MEAITQLSYRSGVIPFLKNYDDTDPEKNQLYPMKGLTIGMMKILNVMLLKNNKDHE